MVGEIPACPERGGTSNLEFTHFMHCLEVKNSLIEMKNKKEAFAMAA